MSFIQGRIPSPPHGLKPGRLIQVAGLVIAALAAGAVADVGMALYVAVAVFLGAAFWFGFLNWRWSVIGLVLYMPISGIATLALYPHTTPGVEAKDFLFVFPAYAGFAFEALIQKRKVNFDGAPSVALAIFVLMVLVQAFNPAIPKPLVAIIGVKVYLTYIPMVWVGYHLVQTREDLRRLLTALAVPALLPAVVGIIEAALIYSGHQSTVYNLYGAAASAATQGEIGNSPITNGADLSRIPSTFSYVAQYYYYTIAMIAVAYAWVRSSDSVKRNLFGWGVFATILTASLLSGSRGAFIFVPVLCVLLLALDRVSLKIALPMIGTIAVGLLVTLQVLGLNVSQLTGKVSTDAGSNGSIISGWVPLALHLTHFGLGAGVDTNAARYAYTGQPTGAAFQLLGGTWMETWWVKIVVELGIPGFLVMLVVLWHVIGRGVVRHLQMQDPKLRSVSAAFLAVLIWNVIYALKAQNIDLDPMDVYFWLFAGVMLRVQAMDPGSSRLMQMPPARLIGTDRVRDAWAARSQARRRRRQLKIHARSAGAATATRAVGRALSTSLVVTLGLQVLNLTTGVLIARHLGPSGRGELTAVVLWPSLLAVLGGLGIADAVTYYAAQDDESRGTLLGSSLALAVGQAVLLIGIGLIVEPIVLHKFNVSTLHSSEIMLVGFLPASLIGLYLLGLLNGSQHLVAYQWLRGLVFLLMALIIIGLAVTHHMSVHMLALGYVTANALTVVAIAVVLWRRERLRIRVRRKVMGRLLSFGIKAQTSTASVVLNERLDQLMVSLFLSSRPLGLYTVASTVSWVVSLVGYTIAPVALPVVARISDAGDQRERARLMVTLTAVISLLCTIPLFFLAPVLIHVVYGHSFHGAVTAARILLVGSLIFSVNRALEAVLKAAGRPLDAGLAEMTALGVTAVALLALLPPFGLVGAASASGVGAIVSCTLLLVRARKTFGLGPIALLVPTPSDVARTRQIVGQFGRQPSGRIV